MTMRYNSSVFNGQEMSCSKHETERKFTTAHTQTHAGLWVYENVKNAEPQTPNHLFDFLFIDRFWGTHIKYSIKSQRVALKHIHSVK